jgi:hypothetical protein
MRFAYSICFSHQYSLNREARIKTLRRTETQVLPRILPGCMYIYTHQDVYVACAHIAEYSLFRSKIYVILPNEETQYIIAL